MGKYRILRLVLARDFGLVRCEIGQLLEDSFRATGR